MEALKESCPQVNILAGAENRVGQGDSGAEDQKAPFELRARRFLRLEGNGSRGSNSLMPPYVPAVGHAGPGAPAPLRPGASCRSSTCALPARNPAVVLAHPKSKAS